ncbi:hypothetical protein BC628DRAFT_1419009 [Trametes gibbosa]|nr:hypothetical protein BC628DRAFT_1419009 [Trametes gibbosa]
MFQVASILGTSALVLQAAALVRPQVPNTYLRSSKHYGLPDTLTDRSLGLATRTLICPVGWAVCSAREGTCYPLDGSECCSNGGFCFSGTVCDSVACCPIGEICDGPAPPPVTIGSGDEPTTTRRAMTPTTTHTSPITTSVRVSTTSLTASPTSTFNPETEDPLEITIFSETPGLSATATTPSSFLGVGTEPGQNNGPQPTASGDRPQFPFDEGNGATPIDRAPAVWRGVLISSALGVLVSIEDTKEDSAVVRDGWSSELAKRVLEYGGSAADFIDKLMPCSVPFPDTESEETLDKTFDRYSPGAGKELSGYDGLINSLNNLVASIPADKRPAMVDTHSASLKFLFGILSAHHHITSPDVSVSFPGIPPDSVTSWQDIAMVMEAKGDESQDPFPRQGVKHAKTVIQLAKSARSLLLAHGFLSAFLVGIYGKTIRLARFDHACALVAPPISMKAGEGGVKLLKRFLWHFVHPVVGDTVVGADPTVAPLSMDDQEWIKMQLDRVNAKNRERHLAEIDKGRRIEVYDHKTGKCVPYLLYCLVDANGRLFSRATMVWCAIEDTRVRKDGHLVPDLNCTTTIKPRIVKESWRQLVRTAETVFYERLEAKIKGKRTGIATMECGGDIGAFEFRWWEETQRRRQAGEIPEPILPTEPETSVQMESLSLPLIEIVDEVGHPLTEFESTRELVTAIRNAIRGHQQAWEEARVLHRDISLGNILIKDEPDDASDVGFIHDFDYSSMEPDSDSDSDSASSQDGTSTTQLKERTGTYFYMAVDLINPKPKDTSPPLSRCRISVLGPPLGRAAAHQLLYSNKLHWLVFLAEQLDVPDNAPLNSLLNKFRLILLEVVTRPHLTGRSAPHEGVLKLFDDALSMDEWPENDWIPCDLLKSKELPTKVTPLYNHDVPPGYEVFPLEAHSLHSQSSRIRVCSGKFGLHTGPSSPARKPPFVTVPSSNPESAPGDHHPPTASDLGRKRILQEAAEYPHALASETEDQLTRSPLKWARHADI